MAPVLVELAHGGWVKPKRLAASLSLVARVSDLHALFVAKVLDSFLGRVDPLPKNLHHLVELQWNVTVQFRLVPCPATRARLESIGGTGKGAKLAKKLLNATSEPSATATTAATTPAIAQTIRARLERVAALL